MILPVIVGFLPLFFVKDADGAAVGVAGHSLSHHYVASADNNQNVSSGEDALVYIEGNSAIKVGGTLRTANFVYRRLREDHTKML